MSKHTDSIGIFDSGVGGLTVMKAIRRALPNENIIYFGDTARVPYGNKSAETICRYSMENALYLQSKGIKLLVIACHTACAYSLELLQEKLDIPVVGVINKGIEYLITYTKTRSVAVLSTRATADSGLYQKYLVEKAPDINLTLIPCPLFAPIVEEGFENHLIAEIAAKEYLKSIKNSAIDTVFLGCTHYPHLCDVLSAELGEAVHLIDPGFYCAQSVKEKLLHHNLLNKQPSLGNQQFFVSDGPSKFQELGARFLSDTIEEVFLVNQFPIVSALSV